MSDAKGVLITFALLLTSLDQAEATCLQDAIPPDHRVNIEGTDGASSVPFGLWSGDWESANLTTYVVKLLAEERLGYHSRVSGMGLTSATSIYATAGCRAPNDLLSDLRCSSDPAFVHHAALEAWGLARVADALQRLAHLPEVIPEDAGGIGYVGVEGMYVKAQQLRDAYRAEGLPLEYYRSYDVEWNRPADYFDNYTALDPTELQPCSDTTMFDPSQIEEYLRVTGDESGVVRMPGGALSARCWHDSWWLAPACRSNPEGCIPWVTTGGGWWLDNAMQKSTAFGMPLAIAVSNSLDTWKSISFKNRILLYWWEPDANFIELGPDIMTFPPFNAQQHAQRVLTSMQDKTRISKWLHRQLAVRAPRLRELVLRVHITEESLTQMLLDLKLRQGNATQEEVACDWLRQNENVWQSWIPDVTECVLGKGLVGPDGSFVGSRANTSDCAWCPPGRSSTRWVDDVGTSHYVCEKCTPGRSQANPGQLECSQCSAGTFADGYESSECRYCTFGEFNAREGMSTCDSCAPGFITNHRGATSTEACICPEGTYRDEERRGACLPCAEGMLCHEGSDAIGYSPGHAAGHPVVPLLRPGFWSSHEQPLSVFRCDDVERCPGGTVPGRACAEGFEKRACAACRADHAQFGSICAPCAKGAVRILLFPALPLAMVILIVAVMYRSNSGAYTTWDSWPKGVGSTFFILLNFYHVVNVIGALISERSVSTTVQSVRALSDLMSIFQPQCAGLRSFASQLVFNSHGPGFLLLVFVFLWLASQLLGLCSPSLRMDTNRLLNCYMSLILTFFTTVVFMAITIFKCSSNPSGVHTLVHDKSVACYEEEWRQLVVVGVLAILFWCVGYGSALLRAIYIASARFHSAAFRTRWTFLFSRYRPDTHYWATVIIARGILLNSGSLFIQSAVGQVYWVFIVLALYAFLLFASKPWRHSLNNLMDGFAHMNLGLTCAIGTFLVREAEESTAVAGHLLRANMAIAAAPFFPIAALMMWRGRSATAKEQKDTDARLILNALHQLFEGTCNEQLDFLKSLTEHDYWIMSAAKNVLLMELGHEKARRGYSVVQLTNLSKATVQARTSEDVLRRMFDRGVFEPEVGIDGVGVQELNPDAEHQELNIAAEIEERSNWAADLDEARREQWGLTAQGIKKAATEACFGLAPDVVTRLAPDAVTM